MEGFLLRNQVEWDRLRHAFADIYGVPVTGVEQFDNESRNQDAPVRVELYEHENGCKLNITIHAAIKNQPRAIDLARRVAVALKEDVITSTLGDLRFIGCSHLMMGNCFLSTKLQAKAMTL